MKRLPFNSCDYRCERCTVTTECAVFQTLQKKSLLHALEGSDENDLSVVLEDVRDSFREVEEMIKLKAKEFGIDIDELAGGATVEEIQEERRNTMGDPLYKQAHEFTLQAHRFLRNADLAIVAAEAEAFDDIAWHHSVAGAKVYRALGWRTDGEELAIDAKNSAAVAMKSLTMCAMAFEHLAPRYPGLAEECERLSKAARDVKEAIRRRFGMGERNSDKTR